MAANRKHRKGQEKKAESNSSHGANVNGASKTLKNWTVMVYLSGDNTLTEEMIYALHSIKKVEQELKDDVQVVALLDTVGAIVRYDIPDPNPAHRGQTILESREAALRAKDLVAANVRHSNSRRMVIEAAASIETSVPVFQQHGKNKLDAERELKRALALRKLAEEAPEHDEEADRRTLHDILVFGDAATPPEEILRAFITDCIKRHPARHYALILSGHGSGAVGDFLTSDKQVSSLSIPGLSDALAKVAASKELERTHPAEDRATSGRWLDILGFDSCLMGMTEVAFEVKESVRYMVGSEGFEANTGWPYDRIVRLFGDEKIKDDPKAIAGSIVDEQMKSYDDYAAADVSVDLSAMNLGSLTDLTNVLAGGNAEKRSGNKKDGLAVLMSAALKEWKDSEAKSAVRDAIVLAHWEAQGYKDEQYVDLWDFCDRLAERTSKIREAEKIRSACREVQSLIDGTSKYQDRRLVFRSNYRGSAFQHSHGVSIFFPWADLKDAAGTSDLQHYGELQFPQRTQWREFLADYLNVTRRAPRETQNREGFHSFLNYRPWLFTGHAAGTRTPTATPRTPTATPRTPTATPRTPTATPRTPTATPRNTGANQPEKIASMKNPPIQWFKRRM